MRDRPIIFSAPMVRALLAGTKTQTRRLAWVKGRSMAMRRASPWQRVQPGARLWVRENWQFAPQRYCSCPQGAEPAPCDDWQDGTGCQSNRGGVVYAADDVKAARWRPSIHMPRWASRITLHVEAVRVQRLQDISEEDARAEGVTPAIEPPTAAALMTAVGRGAVFMPHRSAFANLWNSLHGPDAWAANPEVVALTFRVTKGNIDAA